ncbi:MAG TPA: helix-turn-helix domain-containing protein [Lacibacter sp.]|nr:helix-turn-helix domain-containing protein [Lacibacter sp.]HMO90098.1 helix-turn-helix domain-containing protein [Lacibacter sp.]HMP86531.1 helix-turn-helix domain-containing protein [Lacibacter sp.]
MHTIEINEPFDLAFRFITETQEAVFLTGKAGTGKTTFLKYLKEHTTKNMVVAAPTGVAAINAGGVTLHSLFQLPFHPFLPTGAGRRELLARLRFGKQKQHLFRKLELLVIDEISMVRCDVLDAIDAILRSIRRNHEQPFGGVQLVCIGDLYQLPPVAQQQEWQLLQEFYSSPYFFDSKAVQEQQPLLIELTTIYRQKEEVFVRLLNRVRNNEMTAEDFEELHQRFNPGFRPPPGETFITLTSHNAQADRINNRELQQLHTVLHTYTATVQGDFAENNYPAEFELRLKEGAQVMFLKNDPVGKQYFNGKIGVVESLSTDGISVRCSDGTVQVKKDTWDSIRYTLNRQTEQLEEEVLGSFEQYPLRLAWAVTIHKSQGLTFDNVVIDAAAAFSSGQVYVALSRCTRLEGIVLLSRIPPTALISNDQVVQGQKTLTPKGSLAERFAGARQLFTQQLFDDLFGMQEPERLFRMLKEQCRSNTDQLKEAGKDWLVHWERQLLSLVEVGHKFLAQVAPLLKQQPIEANSNLQKRITDASDYFLAQAETLEAFLRKHPFSTEHKEAAEMIDERLQELAQELHRWKYLLRFCGEPFTVTGYLRHKLQYQAPRLTGITAYAIRQSATPVSGTAHPELYRVLRAWRDATCQEQNLPVFYVAKNETLLEICSYLPLSKEDLLRIKGMGTAKVEKWGPELLDIISDYCAEHQLQSQMHAYQGAPKRERKPRAAAERVASHLLTYEQLQQGKSPEHIANDRNLTLNTVESHIMRLIQSGFLPTDDYVPDPERKRKIEAVIKEYPDANLTDWKSRLADDVRYFDIKLVAWLLEQEGVQ